MSPLEWFGLAADADERAIKRAYAQRLRTTRPEDDPEGFQQLHEIYQAALQQCRGHEMVDHPVITTRGAAPATPTTPAPVPAAPSVTMAESTPPPFDFAAFAHEAIQRAAIGDADALQTWLEAQLALWSLRTKAQAADDFFAQLHRQVPPMPPDCLAALLRFFDRHHVLAGDDPAALQRLQQRMQLAWELQPEHHAVLAARMNVDASTLEHQLRQLARPYRPVQAALTGLIPDAATYLARCVAKLTHGYPEDLPPSYDQRQIHFWLEASAPDRVNKPRLLLGGTRCLATLLCAALVGVMLGKLGATPPATFSYLVMAWVVGMAALPWLLWATWMACLPLEHWHSRPESLPARWPWLNLLLVPLLCTVGLTLHQYAPTTLLLIASVWLAFRRLLLRGHGLSRGMALVLWFAAFTAYPITNALHDGLPGVPVLDNIYVLPATALGLWAWDIWQHRRHLRVHWSGS